MNYDFNKDVIDGEIAERTVACMFLMKCNDIMEITFNKDYRYDILMKLKNEKRVTAQIKSDFMIQNTGNFAFETECRGKPSGVEVTQADLFIVYCKDNHQNEHAYTFKTDYIKHLIHNNTYRTVRGGDKDINGNAVTKMVLIPMRQIINNARDIVMLDKINFNKVAK